MRKLLSLFLFAVIAACCLSACSVQTMSPEETGSVQTEQQTERISASTTQPAVDTGIETAVSDETESAERKLKMTVGDKEVFITLYDTPTANALYDTLPMELSFSDFNGTEKIAYPEENLPTDGEPDGCDPDAGDFCLYAPWGNLSIFYKGFRYSDSLIKLGRIDSDISFMVDMDGDFTAVLERAE